MATVCEMEGMAWCILSWEWCQCLSWSRVEMGIQKILRLSVCTSGPEPQTFTKRKKNVPFVVLKENCLYRWRFFGWTPPPHPHSPIPLLPWLTLTSFMWGILLLNTVVEISTGVTLHNYCLMCLCFICSVAGRCQHPWLCHWAGGRNKEVWGE